MKIEELRKSYHTCLDNAKKLVTSCEEESRSMNDEETKKYKELIQDATRTKTQIETLQAQLELEAEEARTISKTVEHAEPKQKAFRGMGEFLHAVVRGSRQGATPDPRLVEERATGLNESVPSEGGFLVPTEYASELLKNSYDVSLVASKAKRTPVKGNSMTFNYVNETSRADGSRYGGINLYWLNEAGEKTASKPDFGKMELKLKKIIGLYYATDEILEDAVALESDVREMFTEEFGYKIDDAVINGTGAGMPLGILNSGCLVTVNKEAGQAATTVVYENIVKMWSRMWARSRQNAVWFINQDIEPQLLTMSLAVGVGGGPVYLQPGGASASPYATLMGRPVIPIEQCKTLGTVGDIILADYGQYKMIEKNSMQQATSIHVKFVYDETAFRFVYRCDGQPKWKNALTPANGTNTLSPFVALQTRS